MRKMTQAEQRANRGPKSARPTKLRDGTWGATVDGKPRLGEVVCICTAAGKTWEAKVTRIVWSGNGVTICATESVNQRRAGRITFAPASPAKLRLVGESCGYRCPVGGHICTPGNPCHDCE